MASPLGSAAATLPGSVLPCGVVLYGGGTSSLAPCRPPGLDGRVPTLPVPAVGSILPSGLGFDPVTMQLARLSRYQAAAAAAAAYLINPGRPSTPGQHNQSAAGHLLNCLINPGGPNTPGQHQTSAGHLLTYLYARQQQQHRLQNDHCHPNTGDGYLYPGHHQPIHEEPKPNHSYIGIIAMAILGSKERKLVLSDIYQWILDNYPYFRRRGPGWRNSIRHNLSLNDCFIKAGRSANGKGHYWAIHPANVEDFERGDFRRRRAQRKVRRAMGLSVADDDDDSPVPSPSAPPVWTQFSHPKEDRGPLELCVAADQVQPLPLLAPSALRRPVNASRKRLFDVESLLAPEITQEPEVMKVRGPEIDSTTEPPPRRRTDDRSGTFPLLSPDRKRSRFLPEVNESDVIMDLHQPSAAICDPDVTFPDEERCHDSPAAICDDDVSTTSGCVEKKIEDELDVVTVNLLPVSDETGNDGFESSRDVKTTSGENISASGTRAAEPDMTCFWLRHANMTSSRLANALFPFPAANAYHVGRPRDINQSHTQSQGHNNYVEGQGRDLSKTKVHCQGHGEGS